MIRLPWMPRPAESPWLTGRTANFGGPNPKWCVVHRDEGCALFDTREGAFAFAESCAHGRPGRQVYLFEWRGTMVADEPIKPPVRVVWIDSEES